MRAAWRVLAAVTIILVVIAGIPTTVASQGADPELADVTPNRYGGADRYSTSLLVAEAVAADADGALDWAVMVSGRSWPEAVVAASVAGVLDAPILMTPPDHLRADAAAFLVTSGVSRVLMIDSQDPAADTDSRIGDAVVDGLEALDITVERVSGADRYDTAAATARKLRRLLQAHRGDSGHLGAMPGLGRTAIVASGEVFADALVAGPIAARGHHPVLLTAPDELHSSVASYLRQAPVDHVILMGGTAAIGESVEMSLRELGVAITRLAGATRYDTAVKAAELAHRRYGSGSDACFGHESIGIARARVPFDSFSAGPLLARLCAPLVLADPGQIPTDTATFLDRVRAVALDAGTRAVNLQIFGGDAAVSDAALSTYLGRTITTAAPTGTTSTEESGSVAGTGSPALPAGTCGGNSDDPPRELFSGVNSSYPAWSPDCGHIAYSDSGTIWISHIDGSDRRKLVADGTGGSYDPAWSADGSKIAYMHEPYATPNWDAGIWVINVDGTGKTQLTDATYHDRNPAWSPDGTTIAFRRFKESAHANAILTIDVTGQNLIELTSYDTADFSPVWSPDGSTIAFVYNSSEIALMAPDGSDFRPVGGDVDSSISWSPRGDRIVFVTHHEDSSTISTIRTDGLGQETVAEIAGEVHSPDWSPDGDRIAYYLRDGQYHTRVYTVGSAGTPLENSLDCRPQGRSHVTAGLPLPDWAPSAVGTVRVAVLFVDFPDAPAAHSTHEEVASSLPYMEEYLEEASGGRLDLRFSVVHEWLRAEEGYETYIHHTFLATEASQYSAELASGKLDFSEIDAVMTIFPSDQFSLATATGNIDVDGRTIPTLRMNVWHRSEKREITSNGWAAAHELLHVLGLADLYNTGGVSLRPDRKAGSRLARSDFGIMGLGAYHFIDEHDRILNGTPPLPSDQYLVDHWIRFSEMLAWSRYQLGWLSADQFSCVTQPDTVLSLAPVSRDGSDLRLAAVPVAPGRAIALEVRRNIDRDRWTPFANQGILVYTVDAKRSDRPLKIGNDSGSELIEQLPLLGVGDEVTVWGYRIEVLAERDENYDVRIRQVF